MSSRSLPEGFENSIKSIEGLDKESFFDAMKNGEPKVCVRLNIRKPGADFSGEEPVSWNKNAFILKERPEFIFDPLFHAGAYYVQEASSTIYETIVRKLVEEKGGKPLKVLDSCAAPGGKTTAIINALPDGSEVWANEIDKKRVSVLKENLTKWGYPVKITNFDTSYFKNNDETFDIIAVDAPCSGEGMMRKEPVAVSQWNEKLIEKCSLLQREILSNVAESVASEGYLIYSTCTFNNKENEDNVEYIINELGFEIVDPCFPAEWGISAQYKRPVLRFFPHKTVGEGLFVAIFKKRKDKIQDSTVKKEKQNKKKQKRENKSFKENKIQKKIKSQGTLEEVKMEEILSANREKDKFIEVDLQKDEALKYLSGDILKLDKEIPKGIVIVKYGGLPLGPVKNIGERANNLYPKTWRIRKKIEN